MYFVTNEFHLPACRVCQDIISICKMTVASSFVISVVPHFIYLQTFGISMILLFGVRCKGALTCSSARCISVDDFYFFKRRLLGVALLLMSMRRTEGSHQSVTYQTSTLRHSDGSDRCWYRNARFEGELLSSRTIDPPIHCSK